jgi:hypothetical protein
MFTDKDEEYVVTGKEEGIRNGYKVYQLPSGDRLRELATTTHWQIKSWIKTTRNIQLT